MGSGGSRSGGRELSASTFLNQIYEDSGVSILGDIPEFFSFMLADPCVPRSAGIVALISVEVDYSGNFPFHGKLLRHTAQLAFGPC